MTGGTAGRAQGRRREGSGCKVLALPAGRREDASTRCRVLQVLPYLEAAGFQVEVRFPPRPRRGVVGRVLRFADLMRDLYAPAGEEILWIHRKTYPPGLADRLRRPGRAVIYDFDDRIDLPPPGRAVSPWALRRYRANYLATVHQADLVICGNQFLAASLPHERYEVVPTPVDTQRFHPDRVRPAAQPLVGWVGHPDNLSELAALVQPWREISRRFPAARLRVVSSRPPVIGGLPVDFRPWVLDREVHVFDGMWITVMPLADTPWTRGKCAYKAVQSMALALPPVASPVGVVPRVIRHGVEGFLADSNQDWSIFLGRLLEQPDLRAEMGRAARQRVERQFALSVLGPQLAELFAALIHEQPARFWEAAARAPF